MVVELVVVVGGDMLEHNLCFVFSWVSAGNNYSNYNGPQLKLVYGIRLCPYATLGDFVIPLPASTLMSLFEACGIREPKAETKVLLLEKARRLAKQAAEMSGGADSGPREYYYGAIDFNPDIPSYSPPERRPPSTSSSPASGVQSANQTIPANPKSTLNPESKAFVPSAMVKRTMPPLNVGATPFIPRQLVAPPPAEAAATITAEMGALSVVGLAVYNMYCYVSISSI